MYQPTRRGFIAAGALMMLARPLRAAPKPVSLIVPYAAGGPNDNFARLLAEGMSAEIGRPFIVENKPGANGIIGSSYVARAAADGSTLLMGGSGPLSLNILLRPSLQYGFDSFASVAMLFDGPLTITVPPQMGVNSLAELVAYAKREGRPLTYGSLGPGSVTDLYGLILSKTLGIPLTAVPYKSTPTSLMDLISGRNDLSFMTPIALADHQKAGAVKILTLTTDRRDPALPEVPCVTELGYPQLKASYWTALHAPKGTPGELVQAYAAAAIKTVQTPGFRQMLVTNGQTEKAGGPQALDAQLEADRQYWGKVIKDNQIVLD
ncbi:tripartite tricarboxylate transporter substrate binding protein [Bordetella hinzii]|uniref:Tripartite tricarboxylate transporter substrate binding protein n=1 Tax=Bordetella hinzii TaxID=103855 RepID=A0AAN1RUT7_9BORD|nr:tripartite tricarboxylate transporter substrate binding protein [Bordetella hinzii]AKQ58448.1 Tripartite tricarboxylate transporter family receptor [Bordetella hinzii]AZW16235.1 tripartite tricarboxylate transporter substrate binding protein [Bordetella hinzii]QDJ31785.1 tripartite tricarboxylate transporter substrate binding protein [Bordetella hinzii]QET45213.1 tripartite tricarboxylate transporter substrate binding protein [Bordetella hinzii]